ncbi:MAG: SLBB domain-containing protein, partial [Thermomicrobiales bacterium]
MRTTPSVRALFYVIGLATVGLVAGMWALFAFEDRLRPEIVIVQGNTDTTITVGITGTVENPGIYPLPAGSRLDDLHEISGGWAGD